MYWTYMWVGFCSCESPVKGSILQRFGSNNYNTVDRKSNQRISRQSENDADQRKQPMRFYKISHRLFLYTISACQRISENANLGCREREYNKEQSNQAEDDDRQLAWSAKECFLVEEPCFVDIRNRGWYKENGDVEPIGRFTDCTVIGIENDGNQEHSEKNPA